MSTTWAFDNIQNKYSLYHGKDCIRKFCSSLREHATKTIDFEKKKMLSLANNIQNHSKMQKYVKFVEKVFIKKFSKDRNRSKLDTISIILVNTKMWYIRNLI